MLQIEDRVFKSIYRVRVSSTFILHLVLQGVLQFILNFDFVENMRAVTVCVKVDRR